MLEAYLEAVEDGVNTLDPETIAMLRDQTRRLVRFSDDVAALAQAEEGHDRSRRTWVDPQASDRHRARRRRRPLRTPRRELTADVPTGLPRLWADPQRLGQVLGNLLDNALRHTPRTGHVEVTATAAHEC